MNTTAEVDTVLRNAMKYLNSPEFGPEKIRILLDEIIRARYGPSQTLLNTLKRQYLTEEKAASAPAPTTTIAATPGSSSDDSNSMEVEVAYDTTNMMVLGGGDSSGKDDQMEDSDKYKELEELFCAICRDVHTSIRNQLVECTECSKLYHQECHKPAISDAYVDGQSDFQCSKCKSNIPLESLLTCSESSSSSSSPTVFAMTKTSSSSSPHSSSSSKSGGGGGGGGSSSKKSSSGGNGSGGSNSKSTSSGPNMSNILTMSADKRLANMKKKAKLQKTK